VAGTSGAPLAERRGRYGPIVSYVLVDTDVVSFLLNRHSLAAAYEELLLGYTPLLSFMTVAELHRGALKRNWGERRYRELRAHLRQFGVVPYTEDICIAYAQLLDSLERAGKPVALADAWIAASALSIGVPLMTHNRRHFSQVPGLKVLSASPPRPADRE
jgi:predicted nucleic acid-binding protein